MSQRKRRQDQGDPIGRKLVKLLRHRVHENGLASVLRPDGYVPLAAVLALPQFQGITPHMVQQCVKDNDKQRLDIFCDEEGVVYIRANQGHTIGGVDDDALLEPISEADAQALCNGSGLAVHGTYHSAWAAITNSGGLSRMSRQHIHLAPGLPSDSGVISGMRRSCEIHVWVDVPRAIRSGLRFFRSSNGVILTRGDDAGLLSSGFFHRAYDAQTRLDLNIGSANELLSVLDVSNPPPKVIFFWGHSASHGDRACLSNFFPAPFYDPEQQLDFFCSEQYMMHAKAILFGDEMAAKAIQKERNDPRKCKSWGRKVRHFNQTVWDANARAIVERGCFLKFSQNEHLASYLLSTADAILAEASPTDHIWGIGLSEDDAARLPRAQWPGSNWLGEVLMTVRDHLATPGKTEQTHSSATVASATQCKPTSTGGRISRAGINRVQMGYFTST